MRLFDDLQLETKTMIAEKYGHKVKTIEQLCDELGDIHRDRSVIMCHGVFDLVHPGHIRHLIYAKDKADLLIVSITADIHIAKGKYRPHVPERLRALNLAALEIVDYVLIDRNATPIENILALQPNYFAKGYEYVAGGLRPKTSEESVAMQSFGGEVLFTPGDYVLSSSSIIEQAPPQLRTEKLLTLMDSEGIGFDDLKKTVATFDSKHVHVAGDTIVDSYTDTIPLGYNAKTPTLSVVHKGVRHYVGGAAIVAKHLRAAGAKVTFTTVLGDDDLGRMTVEDLHNADVEVEAIIDPVRPTTNKNAIIANGYRLLKIDTLDNTSINDHLVAEFCERITRLPSDAIVFSDFRHGIFNARTVGPLSDSIPESVYKVADSQVASRWGNITEFRGFNLITPNEREARFALADQDSGIRPLASRLHELAECDLLMLKLGARGVLTSRSRNHEDHDSFFVVDSFADNVLDPVGAGDSLLAYATLAMITSGSPAIATILGVFAASIQCEIDGNIPIDVERMLQKIADVEKDAGFH